MATKDAARRAKHNRDYYERNKQARLQKNSEVRARNLAYIREIKERTPCTDCGVSYAAYVMDFDHLGEDKTAHVSYMSNQGVSIATLQREIDKCEVVCSNCHRVRTFTRGKG